MDVSQLTSLVLLVLLLVLAIWRKINIGLLGLAAAAALLVVSGTGTKAVFAHFPGGIFTLLVGVSLLFAHLEKSGGLSWFASKIYDSIGERTALIPWAGYVLGVAITTVGAFSTATITLLVPIIAALCRRHPRIFFISEMAAIIGANTAGLSPLNPTGQILGSVAASNGTHFNGWTVWALGTVISFITVLALQLIFSSKRLVDGDAQNASTQRGFMLMRPAASEETGIKLQPFYALCSAIGVLAFVALVIFAGADVGFASISIAVVLMLIFPGSNSGFLHKIPWNAVIVLCGLLTFIGAMEEVGTMKALEEGLLAMTHNPIILIFLMAYLTTFLANVEASTIGVISLMAPMVCTIFGDSPYLALIIAAIAAPATLSVINPIHVAGTLVVGFTDERQQNALFRRLLLITGCIVVVVPGIVAVLPSVVL
ncbi:SLC13 family permease [Carnimonas bestiolae]|uniref:SLC13 family permease n=1 Tax=Carnimonas bestiolae TaxID=3402172 RepID=UPI003EDC6BA1